MEEWTDGWVDRWKNGASVNQHHWAHMSRLDKYRSGPRGENGNNSSARNGSERAGLDSFH